MKNTTRTQRHAMVALALVLAAAVFSCMPQAHAETSPNHSSFLLTLFKVNGHRDGPVRVTFSCDRHDDGEAYFTGDYDGPLTSTGFHPQFHAGHRFLPATGLYTFYDKNGLSMGGVKVGALGTDGIDDVAVTPLYLDPMIKINSAPDRTTIEFIVG